MMIYKANARRGYDEAMRRVNERSNLEVSKRILNLEEFLAQYSEED
jgi:hypothetical protein